MKILVLAPHPFYQERGTPIAVDLLVRALSERGDQVDLLTFHEGSARAYPGVRIHRIRPWSRMQGVRPGFSGKKLVCDLHLWGRFFALLRSNRYDAVHAVEESAFMALALCPWFGVPFIYDMDSSLPSQLIDKFPRLRHLEKPLRWLESLPIRRARAVVPVCDALAREAARYRRDNILVLKDISLLEQQCDETPVESLHTTLGVNGPLLMYIGNLEAYQGIDLLLASFARLCQQQSTAQLVLIGGTAQHIAYYRRQAQRQGIAARTHLLGPRPVSQLGDYMQQATILLSPRTQGENTPMKIYSYLHSGVAVLATELPTHTQVMTSDIAMLAAPDPAAFAQGMLRLLADDALQRQLARNARAFIEREHSYTAFKRKLYALYDNDLRLPPGVCYTDA